MGDDEIQEVNYSLKRRIRVAWDSTTAKYFNCSMRRIEMATSMALACCSLVVLGLSFIAGSANEEFSVVDLTHELNADAVFWPGNPGLLFTILNRGPTPTGYWYESNKFATSEHGGTHLDAPAHFAEGKWRVHEIPAERLVGSGVVVNVISRVEENPDYRLDVSDLLEWERKYGVIPNGAIVFMQSGWSPRYPNKTLTFNSDNVTDPATFHFPGFHPDAIDWLVQHRNISMIGVDTPSTDFGQSKTFDTHQKVARAGIIGLENVNNLDKIPPSGSTIFVGVIKLFDGSGGPIRILAMVGKKVEPACICTQSGSNDGMSLSGSIVFILISLFFVPYMK